MIKKTSIVRFVKSYHGLAWLFQIPFVLYFACALVGIEEVREETKQTKETINGLIEARRDKLWTQFQDSVYIFDERNALLEFQKTIQPSFTRVMDPAFIKLENWEDELDFIEEEFQEYQNYHGSVFGIEGEWWNEGGKTLKVKNYPLLRSYVSLDYAQKMVYQLQNKMWSSGCCFGGGIFDPIVQREGDNYLFYPRKTGWCDIGYHKFFVNGHPIENKEFLFLPKEKGIHELNIRLEYRTGLIIQTKIFHKSLEVI